MITNDDVIRACYIYHRHMMRELFLEHQTPAFQIALQNAEKHLRELDSELDEADQSPRLLNEGAVRRPIHQDHWWDV